MRRENWFPNIDSLGGNLSRYRSRRDRDKNWKLRRRHRHPHLTNEFPSIWHSWIRETRGKEGTGGGGGMKEKFEKGAAEGICCPSYEGGMYPIPGGAIWGIPGVGENVMY